ncbi:hypothetical protein LSTR_LSTR012115 [Laodelphax striatellus]|uniref:C-type lectin domain-containing protein n=1 Tax=Laodelphax striatellus TaxID=195883 RepID=A0A482WXU4_LAOST|nr:hypothetical protein LSTR_LSTR012115 [Laodelphax striatellus]
MIKIWIVLTFLLLQVLSDSLGADDDLMPEMPELSWLSSMLEDISLRDNKVIKMPLGLHPQAYGSITPVNLPERVVTQNKPPQHNNNNNNNINNNHNHVSNNKEVSETDLYLLGAIEKLVYRVDLMEKRLRRTEELLHHVMDNTANTQREDPCPANFTRVQKNCYHFSDRQFNWKSASSMCKSLGSNLMELETADEYTDLVTFIQSDPYLRGREYWTGGLNPGLLWIWSNSAQPVVPKNPNLSRPSEVVHSSGNGRCLKLTYHNIGKIYQYYGSDCSARLHYVCEHEENTTIRALKRIHKSLEQRRSL